MLVCANNGYFDECETADVKRLQKELLENIAVKHTDIVMQINSGAKLDDVLTHQILEAAGQVRKEKDVQS